MSLTYTPNSAPYISQDVALRPPIEDPQTLEVDNLKKSNAKLTTENRWLRKVIRGMGKALTEAEDGYKLSINSFGIFQKTDAKLNIYYSNAQKQRIKVWSSAIHDIVEYKKAFDATGAEDALQKYESAIKSWRASHLRQDDIEIIICQRVVGERMSNLMDALENDIAKLKSEVNRLESELITNEEQLKIQAEVIAGLQEKERTSAIEVTSKHEKELKERSGVVAHLKENEKIAAAKVKEKHERELKERDDIIAELKKKASASEIKSGYEQKLKDKDTFIAILQQKEKNAATDIKNEYEKKLKEKDTIIANFEKCEEDSVTVIKDEYEEKLKEQNSVIAKLEEEKRASRTEMKGLRRELAAHSEVSISILNRKRELMKSYESRDDHLIETGNLSAHSGTCLADVFRIKSNTDVDDSPWFYELYGVPVNIVEKLGDSTAFAKLVNMRYDMYSCKAENRDAAVEFEKGFQELLNGITERDTEATPEVIDGYLLRHKKEVFQKLCGVWDSARASQKKRFMESRDPKKRSVFGGSLRSSASVLTGETARRSKLDKIEEYGKDIIASAKDAMLWTKH